MNGQKNRKTFSQAMRTSRYVMEMIPTLNRDAVFADESADYVSPPEPKVGDMVTFRVRTAKANVDEVWLVSEHLRQKLDFEKTQGVFDFYSTRVQMGRDTLCYHFQIISGNTRQMLGKSGLVNRLEDVTAFRLCPGFSTPDWAKGAVMYQIYIDRFFNGDPSNDVLDDKYYYVGRHAHHVKEWYQRPESMDVANFYGGDLEGVRQKLDYLKELGIEAIYFNPLFVSPSNHKYDTQDYDHIDPHIGKLAVDEGEVLRDGAVANTEASRYICRVTKKENLAASDELFRQVISEAHARGIRVILDGVFNHCGSFNKWLDREKIYSEEEGYEPGAYRSSDSPYLDYFAFDRKEKSDWPENGSYDGWWGHDTLPKLNYEESEKLRSYILYIARKWVSPPYNADGWRLDVAADLGHSTEFNHRFWRAFRHEVKAANPDAVIIAEHYGNASDWLAGDQWDTVMNYDAFMEPMTWFFTGMEKHSDEFRPELIGDAWNFRTTMERNMCAFMQSSLLCSMNQLSNHDHSRFLTRTNHKTGRVSDYDYDAASENVDPAVMREAVIFQMTWPGAPTLYYGDEAGVTGFTDPDSRRTYPWGKEDLQMLQFHKDAIAMHREHEVLRSGSVRFLKGDKDFISYARFNKDHKIVCAFNNSDEKMEVTLPVWIAGVSMDGEMTQIFATDAQSWTTERKKYPVEYGELTVTLPPKSAVVLAARRKVKFAQKPRWW